MRPGSSAAVITRLPPSSIPVQLEERPAGGQLLSSSELIQSPSPPPPATWPSNSAMQQRTLCPKSFSMGEQRCAFTSNSQLYGGRPEETIFGKKLSDAIQPFHVKELRWHKGCPPLRKSLSFCRGAKIETDLPNPPFPSAPDINIAKSCKCANHLFDLMFLRKCHLIH